LTSIDLFDAVEECGLQLLKPGYEGIADGMAEATPLTIQVQMG